MSNYKRKYAQSAVTAGAFLPLCALSGLSPKGPINDFFSVLTTDLSVLGLDINLDDLKVLQGFTKEEALQTITNTKERLISTLERAYGSEVSSWFELGFSLSLMGCASTTSDRTWLISTAKEHLKTVAIQAGYAQSKLDNILDQLQYDGFVLVDVITNFLTEAVEIMDTPPRPRLFISYGSGDHDLAKEFATLCKKANIDTFVASIDIPPGTDWYDRLGDEIRRSDEILLILSPQSIHSHWVMIEVGAAWALGKQIIPVVLYADINALPEPIKRFQAQKVISAEARRDLVKKIAKRMHNQN
jgi:hypothetical protein